MLLLSVQSNLQVVSSSSHDETRQARLRTSYDHLQASGFMKNFLDVCLLIDLKYVAISKHTCVTCGKTYKHKHHLKRHHDFECGVDPKFKCAFCPHRTRYKDSLMKHILARHQHLLEQNSQYGHQQVFETHTDVEMNFHAQETNAFNVYPDFTQNL
ncbi:Longitudinals lacking protein, isoforms N/O/W/X/Y [Trachymyrmex septentrionalis]|uniref:Longitudinals lacking protein, isoforms N/O/W/X/Y n=1 Tax=Trachymyrmex septentrionalis TaxID=34720 RepID=A0A195EVY9_9HYME|nr:Longitudinals lacking protein, isoforms N/O/W/X/Y [Trachymyrmex septentrionalis]